MITLPSNFVMLFGTTKEYKKDLIQLKKENHPLIFEFRIPLPTPEEISKIRRYDFKRVEQALYGLSSQIILDDKKKERMVQDSFSECLRNDSGNVNKVVNDGYYQIAWLNRYNKKLKKMIVFLGLPLHKGEFMFLTILAHSGFQVVILNPDKKTFDKTGYELVEYPYHEFIGNYPTDTSLRTVASQAEAELNSILYNGDELFRNYQYTKMKRVLLHTTYDEISILWNQDLKFRPGFKTEDDFVHVPVLFSKISGVDNETDYLNRFFELKKENTLMIENQAISMVPNTVSFFKNGKLLRKSIKKSANYKYGFLKDEVQERILDGIETLIQMKMIKGTGENGMEYTILSVLLNLSEEILSKINAFDLTGKNPKAIFVSNSRDSITKEPAILLAFLSLIGFDVVFYVPTGYQTIETFYNFTFDELQIGENRYDIVFKEPKKFSFFDIFR